MNVTWGCILAVFKREPGKLIDSPILSCLGVMSATTASRDSQAAAGVSLGVENICPLPLGKAAMGLLNYLLAISAVENWGTLCQAVWNEVGDKIGGQHWSHPCSAPPQLSFRPPGITAMPLAVKCTACQFCRGASGCTMALGQHRQ